jgi:histidinol dehydrogenase
LQRIYAGYKDLKSRGIQAIAGLTFGTETIPKVYKILVQKSICNRCKTVITQFGVAIDMPAGPSELLIADDDAVPGFVASDLLSQAEHGADSQVILVSTSKKIDAVEDEIHSNRTITTKEIAEKLSLTSKLILSKMINCF